MEEFRRIFREALDREDKARCVEMALDWLKGGRLDVLALYDQVLAPALNEWECPEGEADVCIWKEHVRTSIVRTVVESAYPYVVKEVERRGMDAKGPKERAVVLCPPDEYHDVGARMVADWFTISGFDVTFVGAAVPVEDFVAAVGHIRPRYVAISVTNPYNLIALRKLVEAIRGRTPEGTEILVGGKALEANPGMAKQIGADRQMRTFEDVHALKGGD